MRQERRWFLLAMGLFVPLAGGRAQDSRANEFRIPLPIVAINQTAQLARSGSPSLIRAHTESILSAFFPSSYIPGILKDKLYSLELEHQQKGPRFIREADVVRALNGFADRIGAPEYAKTSLRQFRYVRVSLLPSFPGVIAGGSLRHEQPLAEPEGLPTEMSPSETALVVAVLVQRKLGNETYQVTPAEWSARMGDLQPRLGPTQPTRITVTLRVFEESERGATIRKKIAEYATRLGSPEELNQEMERFVQEVYNAR